VSCQGSRRPCAVPRRDPEHRDFVGELQFYTAGRGVVTFRFVGCHVAAKCALLWVCSAALATVSSPAIRSGPCWQHIRSQWEESAARICRVYSALNQYVAGAKRGPETCDFGPFYTLQVRGDEDVDIDWRLANDEHHCAISIDGVKWCEMKNKTYDTQRRCVQHLQPVRSSGSDGSDGWFGLLNRLSCFPPFFGAFFRAANSCASSSSMLCLGAALASASSLTGAGHSSIDS